MARATYRPDAPRRRLGSLLLTAFCAAAVWCLAPATAYAQGPASTPPAPQAISAHPDWTELTPVQQRILSPLQPLWDSLPELNRRKWLRIAERYPKFSPEEQARLQTRMAEWVKLTPQQRRLARENYQITRALPAQKKAEAWDKYQQLPEDQKKKLAAAEHVPRRPGAVSALPSGKRLPSDTGRPPICRVWPCAASPICTRVKPNRCPRCRDHRRGRAFDATYAALAATR